MLRLLAAAAAVALAVPALAADPVKVSADTLSGAWKVTKSSKPLPPNGSATLTVSKDGKYVMAVDLGGGAKFDMPGTWSLDGGKLKTTTTNPGGKEDKQVMEVTLTADTLVTKDEKGVVTEFVRAGEAKDAPAAPPAVEPKKKKKKNK